MTHASGRLRFGIAGVTAAALIALIGACGDRSPQTSATGPSSDEVAVWVQAIDAAGQRLDASLADYEAVVVSVERAVKKNEKDLAAWDKEWKKRQRAYEKRVEEVEAHNAAERQKAADNPQHIEVSSSGEPAPGLPSSDRLGQSPLAYPTPILIPPLPMPKIRVVPGYQPHYLPMPETPEYPKKVGVRLKDEVGRLRRIARRVATLSGTVATLQVGEELEPALMTLQSAVAALEKRIESARKALRKAVKKDEKRGDIIRKKKVAKVTMGDLAAEVATARSALAQAIEANGLDLILVWPAGDASASPSPAVSPSPSAADAAASPSGSP